MDLLRAFILGVVQAITEFLPISSSAHLIVFREWIGFDSVDGLTFDVALHMGTLLAVIVYFRRDLGRLVTGALKGLRTGNPMANPESRLMWTSPSSLPTHITPSFKGDSAMAKMVQ